MKGEMVLLISDTHVGETTSEYNIDIFRQRVNNLLQRFVKVKQILNKGLAIPTLNVIFLGDIVSGEGVYRGQPYNLEITAQEQVKVSAAVFDWFIDSLAPRFKEINVYGVEGNHGRVSNEAISNWDNVFYMWLQERLESKAYINNMLLGGWKQIFDVMGWRYLAFHGDQVRMSGTIPLMAIQRRILRWYAGALDRFDVATCGHFHTTMFLRWNDIAFFGNGAMITGSDYPVRTLGLKEDAKYWVIVADKDNPVRWVTLIDLR